MSEHAYLFYKLDLHTGVHTNKDSAWPFPHICHVHMGQYPGSYSHLNNINAWYGITTCNSLIHYTIAAFNIEAYWIVLDSTLIMGYIITPHISDVTGVIVLTLFVSLCVCPVPPERFALHAFLCSSLQAVDTWNWAKCKYIYYDLLAFWIRYLECGLGTWNLD